MDIFRVHHILCASNYEGKGYSGAFCENMTAIVDRLRSNPDEALELVARPDMICRNCPNKIDDRTCKSNGNRVVEKDRRIADVLELTEGGTYTYRELCRAARRPMTPQLFSDLCGECSWKDQGLCKYENFIAQLDACING